MSWTVSDALTVTRRNLIRYVRLPTLLVFSTIQPVMFVLLFRYVFAGAIGIPGPVDYVSFLMPGIFIQTVVFGSTQTGVGLAEDLQHGMIERFRSLPMARSAVLAGRTISDTVRNLFVVLLMTGVGIAVGFRIHGGVLAILLALVLALMFGFAFSWISAYIGLSAGNVEAAQAGSFVWILPAHVRQCGVRARGKHAGLVAGVGEGEPCDDHRRSDAGTAAREPARPGDPGRHDGGTGPGDRRLDRRDPRRVRSALGLAIPEDRVAVH